MADNKIEVIASCDPSIGNPDKYDEYSKTLDESLLSLESEPTRFVLRKTLPYKAARAIKDQQITFTGDKNSKINLSFTLEDVRMSLIDIKNGGESLVYKRGSDGYADEDLIALLNGAGIVNDLYVALEASRSFKKEQLKKS